MDDTVKTLEERVHTLEKEVEQKAAASSSADGASEETTAALIKGIEGRWTEFRSDFEESWRREREGLQTEREKSSVKWFTHGTKPIDAWRMS